MLGRPCAQARDLGTLTGKPRFSLKSKKSILTRYFQLAPCKSRLKGGPVKRGSSVAGYIVLSENCRGTVKNIPNTATINKLLSPGSQRLLQLKPKPVRRKERGGTKPADGRGPVKEVVGEEGKEVGEIEDHCLHHHGQHGQHSDPQSRVQTLQTF